MTNKKNPFFRFCFSLIPGAGEMYMGFLKTGVSLMLLFIAIFVLAAGLRIGVLSMLNLVVWFYSFFHVHSLADMPDEEFYTIEDQFLFIDRLPNDNMKFFKHNGRLAAFVLIFMGIVLTWQNMLYLLREYLPDDIYGYIYEFSYSLPRIIAGIAIIALGVRMIRGPKPLLTEQQKKEERHGSTP